MRGAYSALLALAATLALTGEARALECDGYGHAIGTSYGVQYGICYGDVPATSGAVANAGTDVSATIPAVATIDATGSTGAVSYATTIESGPTTASTCSDSGLTGYHGGDLWQCSDGSAAEVVDGTTSTPDVYCSAGDDDGAGAGAYVAEVCINGGASCDTVTINCTCTTPLPGYFQLCHEAAVSELDAVFPYDVGTNSVDDFPAVPVGPLTPTTAGTIGALNTAVNTHQSKVTLTASIDSLTAVNLASAQDLEIDLAGYRLDYIQLASTTEAAQRVHIYDSVGGGAIGSIQHTAGDGTAPQQHVANDIVLDGFRLGPDFASATLLAAIPDGAPAVNIATFITTGNVRVNRIAFVNMIVKGRDDDADAGITFSAFLLAASNAVIANTNATGGTGGTNYGPGRDEWAERVVGNDASVWNVDAILHSGLEKAAIRSNAEVAATLYFTTPGARVTSRNSAVVHVNNRNLEQNNAAITAHYYVDWYLDGFHANLAGAAQSTDFGCNEGQDYYYGSHLNVYTPTVITGAGLAGYEVNAVVEADSDVGAANVYAAFTAAPSWPAIVGGASKGYAVSVGSNPFSIP